MIEPHHEPPPPLMGTWPKLYAAVIGSLLLCIILFGIFGKYFS